MYKILFILASIYAQLRVRVCVSPCRAEAYTIACRVMGASMQTLECMQ